MTRNSSNNDSWIDEVEESWPTAKEIVSSPHWYMSLSIEILVILINGWISVSFMHHVLAKNLLLKKYREKDHLIDGTVVAFTLAALFLPFFRYLTAILVLVVGLYPGEKTGCEVANDVSVVGFAFAVFPTYAYLWARQRVFYRRPPLKNMTGACSQLLSKYILLLILLSACVSVGLGIYPTEYEHGPGGCILIGNEEQDDYRTYIYAVLMIASQACVLGLLLHPMFLHSRHQRSLQNRKQDETETETSASAPRTRGDDECSSNQYKVTNQWRCQYSITLNETPSRRTDEAIISNSLLPLDGGKDVGDTIDTSGDTTRHNAEPNSKDCSSNDDRELFDAIQRVFFLYLIPIITDLSATLINQFCIPDDVPQTYSFVLFDINVLIHVLTVVFSFKEWREIVFFPCVSKD